MFRKQPTFKYLRLLTAAAAMVYLTMAGTPLAVDDEYRRRNQMPKIVIESWLDATNRFHEDRSGLLEVSAAKAIRPAFFNSGRWSRHRFRDYSQRQEIRRRWIRHLELDRRLEYLSGAAISVEAAALPRAKADQIAASVYAARYRGALELINAVEKDPILETILNEADPDLGMLAGSYADYKTHFLSSAVAMEFAAMAAQAAGAVIYDKRMDDCLSDDIAVVRKLGRQIGGAGNLKSILDSVARGASRAIFPLQSKVAVWLAETKVFRRGIYAVTADHIQILSKVLKPGDIVLRRREWFLSTYSVPGFWVHALVYIGTPRERAEMAGNPSVKAWLDRIAGPGVDLEAYLHTRFGDKYRANAAPVDDRVKAFIEAGERGVALTTLEEAASADALAILRPRLDPAEKVAAIAQAFAYVGRPYDYDFDFITDSALMCTELVAKAYESDGISEGLSFPVTEIAGRFMIIANDIARQFDEEYGLPRQRLDLIGFIDGRDGGDMNGSLSLEKFRQSWRRSQWYALTQAALTP